MSPTLIIGLGNPLLTDDGAGIEVLRLLQARLGQRDDLVFKEDCHGGLRLMERMVGFERAIVVDAAMTGGVPGSVFEVSPGDLPTAHSASTHDATLRTALSLGRIAGATLPHDDDIRLIGIEAADTITFHEGLTPIVNAALPKAVERVLELLDRAPTWGPPLGPLEAS